MAKRAKRPRKITVSMPARELEILDAIALRCQTRRSHFIRQAVKHFAAKIFPDEELFYE